MNEEQEMETSEVRYILHDHALEHLEKLMDGMQTDVRSICVEQGRIMQKLSGMEILDECITDHESRLRLLEQEKNMSQGIYGAVRYVFDTALIVGGIVAGWLFKGA